MVRSVQRHADVQAPKQQPKPESTDPRRRLGVQAPTRSPQIGGSGLARGARLVAGGPCPDEGGVPSLDLLPGCDRVEVLEAPPSFAMPAEGPLRPSAAAGGAGPQVVVAGEAEHEQVVLRVVAALQDAKHVVDIELPLRGGHPAGLAAIAAGSDQPAAAGRGELGSPGAAIVGLAESLAKGRGMGAKAPRRPLEQGPQRTRKLAAAAGAASSMGKR
jgi:hypothetical protein